MAEPERITSHVCRPLVTHAALGPALAYSVDGANQRDAVTERSAWDAGVVAAARSFDRLHGPMGVTQVGVGAVAGLAVARLDIRPIPVLVAVVFIAAAVLTLTGLARASVRSGLLELSNDADHQRLQPSRDDRLGRHAEVVARFMSRPSGSRPDGASVAIERSKGRREPPNQDPCLVAGGAVGSRVPLRAAVDRKQKCGLAEPSGSDGSVFVIGAVSRGGVP